MPELLCVPEIAANTTEVTLVSWPIADNTAYRTKDVIAVVETAKAAVDLEAETDGVILKRLVTEGTDVPVGMPIALIGAPGEVIDDLAAALAALGVNAPPTAIDVGVANGHARVFASPLARRLARVAGVTVADLQGTGPHGRILRRDVERAMAPTTPTPAHVRVESVPESLDTAHTRIRRAVAERMEESKRTVPHFYLRGTARVDELLSLRAALNSDAPPVRVSITDLVLKAMARAHVLVPAMNVIWTPDTVRSFDTVDIAVAIASARGLVTPVLRSIETMTISSVAVAVRDFVDRAGTGLLHQHELEGGSATVSNLGMYATEEFAAIINPPQSSILAVGAVREEPVAVGGEVIVASVLRVTLSVDHRPIDGATAAEWMRAFVAILEHPVRILA